VRLADLARIQIVRNAPRIAELDGEASRRAVSSCVSGKNALETIDRQGEDRLPQVEPAAGVEIVPTYDARAHQARRSNLGRNSSRSSSWWRWCGVLSFSPALGVRRDRFAAARHSRGLHRHVLPGLNANIMSLGGIAIAIGAMVDAAVVMIENAHKRARSLASTRIRAERSRRERWA